MNIVSDLIISSLSCIFSLRFLNYLPSRLGSFYMKVKNITFLYSVYQSLDSEFLAKEYGEINVYLLANIA